MRHLRFLIADCQLPIADFYWLELRTSLSGQVMGGQELAIGNRKSKIKNQKSQDEQIRRHPTD